MSKVSTKQKSFLNRKEVDKSLTSNIDEITRAVGGFISDEFDCVHNNFHGKVYAGPSAILFAGRIFFFDWCQKISWIDVVQVKKKSLSSVDIVVNKEATGTGTTTYTFDNLFDADRVWSSLVDLHSDSILDTPPKPPTPKEISRSLRRTNSDPFNFSKAVFDDEIEGTEEENEDPQMEILGNNSMTEDLSWTSLLHDAKSYSHTAVKDLELRCSLDTFFDLFISDSANNSIQKYMQGSGDEDVYCSSWERDDSVMKRVINYKHPVNSPMAPPLARARREQKFRRYAGNGMALESKTVVEDVPMTDCFFVVEMIRVAAMKENQISVTMAFDIRFVKSTMFKGIITRTTNAEVEKSLKGLAEYMSKNLDHTKHPVSSLEESKDAEKEPQGLATASHPMIIQSYVFSVFLFLMLVLQIYILWTLFSLQADIAKLAANSLSHVTLPGDILLESANVLQYV